MEKINILVVEDENILALGLKKKLENLGYAVSGMADSGEETFRQIEAKVPDLILMDIVIKGDIDGIETAARLKKSYSIPVIYLTAYADDEILKRAARTEPYGYILKPYKEKELKANIEMAIYRKKSENEETFDFEDIYKETTSFINKNENSFKKILLGPYLGEVEVSVDVGTTKLYISAARGQKTSDGLDISEVLSRIAFNYVDNYGGEALIYPKGDEVCLELDKSQF